MTAGLSGVYAVAERPQQVADALADPVGTLAAASGTRRAHVVARSGLTLPGWGVLGPDRLPARPRWS